MFYVPLRGQSFSKWGGSTISATMLCRSQLSRLLQMILALRSGRFPNANQLAELCEVSRRTVYRDLDALLRAGVPVRYRSDRQGYELGAGFFLDPIRLEEDEVAALLLRTCRGGAPDWPSLARKAESAALKCAQGLSEKPRRRVLALAELIEDETAEPEKAPARIALHRVILQAIGDRRQVRLRYQEPGEEAEVVTRLSIYRLHFDGASWRLIGRSSYHREIRVLPIPWIRHAEPTEDPYNVPPRFRPDRISDRGEPSSLLGPLPNVRLRLRGNAATKPGACPWPPAAVVEHRNAGEGEVELIVSIEDRESLKRWVLGSGGDVEVLSPPDLRKEIQNLALRMAQVHSATPAAAVPIEAAPPRRIARIPG